MGEKSKLDEKLYRLRYGILETLLLFQIAGSAVGIVTISNKIADYAALSAELNTSVSLGWSSYAWLLLYVIAIVCVLGLWKWKAWAYKGLISIYIVGFILAIVTINIFLAVVNFAGAVVLEAALNNKKDWLE
jgi:cell division protein FtsW (lipid II flippase)